MPDVRGAAGKPVLKLKRIYDPPEPSDGYRVLVDRLWPRGFSKERAKLDLWLKEIAPSDALRKWFGHDPGRWCEFQNRYRRELREKSALLSQFRSIKRKNRTLTLLYGARDDRHNQAVVLKQVLKSASKKAVKETPTGKPKGALKRPR